MFVPHGQIGQQRNDLILIKAHGTTAPERPAMDILDGRRVKEPSDRLGDRLGLRARHRALLIGARRTRYQFIGSSKQLRIDSYDDRA